jgi:hypothetical protein
MIGLAIEIYEIAQAPSLKMRALAAGKNFKTLVQIKIGAGSLALIFYSYLECFGPHSFGFKDQTLRLTDCGYVLHDYSQSRMMIAESERTNLQRLKCRIQRGNNISRAEESPRLVEFFPCHFGK